MSTTAHHAAWQLVLPPASGFTHLTAAAIYGGWMPPVPDDLTTWLSVPETVPRPRRRELRTSRLRVMPDLTQRDGIGLLPADEVLLGRARDLGALDLVVLIDSAVRSGDTSLDQLTRLHSSGRPGSARLRVALRLADQCSESAWESLLRVLHVVCDVSVDPQHDVYDESVFLGRADLRPVGTQVLHEYDGGEHMELLRQRKDLRRGRRLGNSQWLHQRRRAAPRRDDPPRRRPEPEPARIRAWHALLAPSLFTPMGTARLRRRRRIPDPTGRRGARAG